MCIDKNFKLHIDSCECKDSQFCAPHHGHIITSDFRIIENRKLRKLLTKGPNFRPSINVRYDKCKTVIEDAIESFIEKLSSKHRLDKSNFNKWKTKVLQKVSDKIRVFKIQKKPIPTKSILKDPEVQSYLSSLHQKYVIVLIDKVSNNLVPREGFSVATI